MPDLLIELFSEEIPARMQARAAEDLRARMTDALVEAGLTYAGAAGFATPRRLALTVQGLLAESPTTREERKGPRVDAPEKAIEGFLRGAGVARDDLQIRDEKKGQVYYATLTRPGRPAAEIVAEELEKVIRNFPWPKSMRWGTGSLRWVRPLHSILCILTDDGGEAQVVDLEIDGIRAGTTTRGHRFMAPDAFFVTSFEDYTAKLKRTHVILDAQERADRIWHDATNQAFAGGYEVVEDRGLLTEVAGLVEWPVVLMGRIGAEFLDLPPEVLQTSMKEHQKFFSVRNPRTARIERFVTVANIEAEDHGATILAGNQKVLAARLSDAKFFWENDLRTVRDKGLEGMAEGLANVTFHNKLGSQADRVARIEALAREIAPLVGAKPDLAAEAARVCKADLQSEMVGEFPELQGLMGRYYAEAAGHDDGVPEACEEHYKPLGPGDAVPSAPVSVAVALADKIDTLVGFWSKGEKPTGSKDPYALRRAGLGVIRLVMEGEKRLNLLKLTDDHFQNAFQPMGVGLVEVNGQRVDNKMVDLLTFLHDRLKVHLRDEGIRHDVIDACLAMPGNDDLTLLVHRATALSDFLKTEDGENLLQGFKRANNILTQAEEKDGVEYSFGADVKFAETDEEEALFAALDQAEPQIATALEAEDFAAAMSAMADLRAPTDAFFEAVQVNVEKPVIRRNRLNLLSRIRTICLQAADLTRVEG
jgi:glycyl-tRNA synthetase beta chain